MGWLNVVLGLGAAILFWIDDHVVGSIISVLLAVAAFWSWGVMHNYATDEARKRSDYSGGFYDITPQEANSVPNWIAGISLLTGVGTLIAFICSVVFWLI